jgi:thymidylate kinase
MKIITFSGIDGSGKSSQLGLLRKHLEANGARTAYFHAIQWSLPQAAKRLFRRTREVPGESQAVIKSSGFGVILRQGALLIDLIRFRKYVRNLEHSGIEYLLSDRYFYDSLVNIAYLDGTSLDTAYARFAIRRIPKPYRAFFLSIAPENALERERPPEQGITYLKDKDLLFKEAATLWSFTVIDADQASAHVSQDILRAL